MGTKLGKPQATRQGVDTLAILTLHTDEEMTIWATKCMATGGLVCGFCLEAQTEDHDVHHCFEMRTQENILIQLLGIGVVGEIRKAYEGKGIVAAIKYLRAEKGLGIQACRRIVYMLKRRCGWTTRAY
ncbi:MAG: hypothetical protein ACXQS4_05035 [Methermicoccaceae archaeon]